MLPTRPRPLTTRVSLAAILGSIHLPQICHLTPPYTQTLTEGTIFLKHSKSRILLGHNPSIPASPSHFIPVLTELVERGDC